jgi:hypothetical protein
MTGLSLCPCNLDTAIALLRLSRWVNVPSFLRNADLGLDTTSPSSIYDYQFGGAKYPNLEEVVGYGEAQYSNNTLHYCSVQSISMMQYSYQVSSDMLFPVRGCV